MITKQLIISCFCFFLTGQVTSQYFVSTQAFPLKYNYFVKFADFDNDGDLDLFRIIYLSITQNGFQDEIWLNDGQGNYTLQSLIASGEGIGGETADFDNDGDIDIFILDHYGHNKIWFNDGLGNFTTNAISLSSLNPYDCSIGDFDNDGDVDIYICTADFSANDVMYLNNGSGLFTSSIQSAFNVRTLKSKSIDIDLDGDIDIIRTSPDTFINILVNDGNGNFTESILNVGGTFSNILAVGDCNDDGYPDLIINSDQVSGTISQYLGSSNGTYTYDKDVYVSTQLRNIQFADMDKDDDLDLVLTIFSNTDSSKILLNDGLGNYSFLQSFNQRYVSQIAIGDIDNDNDNDLLLMSMNNVSSKIWKNFQTFTNVTDLSFDFFNSYPNPAQNEVFLSFDEQLNHDKITFIIVDVLGEQVLSGSHILNKPIDISSLNNGYYIVQAQVGEQYVSKSLIVNR